MRTGIPKVPSCCRRHQHATETLYSSLQSEALGFLHLGAGNRVRTLGPSCCSCEYTHYIQQIRQPFRRQVGN